MEPTVTIECENCSLENVDTQYTVSIGNGALAKIFNDNKNNTEAFHQLVGATRLEHCYDLCLSDYSSEVSDVISYGNYEALRALASVDEEMAKNINDPHKRAYWQMLRFYHGLTEEKADRSVDDFHDAYCGDYYGVDDYTQKYVENLVESGETDRAWDLVEKTAWGTFDDIYEEHDKFLEDPEKWFEENLDKIDMLDVWENSYLFYDHICVDHPGGVYIFLDTGAFN